MLSSNDNSDEFYFKPTCNIQSLCPAGVHGDSLVVLQAPEFVSFQKGDWPISGEKIPDLVALTMGFSVKEVLSRSKEWPFLISSVFTEDPYAYDCPSLALIMCVCFSRTWLGQASKLVRCSSVPGLMYWWWSEELIAWTCLRAWPPTPWRMWVRQFYYFFILTTYINISLGEFSMKLFILNLYLDVNSDENEFSFSSSAGSLHLG